MCAERQQFDHVIVDEFQDLNRAEQMLVDLLAGQGSLNVIGSEDQSIYSFKHAHPEGIATFAQGIRVHDETLSVCRHCPTDVVTLAKQLDRSQRDCQRSTALEPRRENGAGDVEIVQWGSLAAEAVGIAQ